MINTYAPGEDACGNCGGLILIGERIEIGDESVHLGPCCASWAPPVCRKTDCNLVHNGECF